MDNVFYTSIYLFETYLTRVREKNITQSLSFFDFKRIQLWRNRLRLVIIGLESSVIQVQFYHYEDKWIQVDGPWTYAVQFLLTSADLEQSDILFNENNSDI